MSPTPSPNKVKRKEGGGGGGIKFLVDLKKEQKF